ncbi:VWA domain-containing protein [Streptomyces sp. ACA25]|uniref:vWA domain-containing protein n=1 Tax=Streptomyces sp. ACA25 TaxID=3022596 RepID=UPI002307E168|nr:VWA domain-containing protein [Streptomyces sp. ACA25]MDB1086396.1 VWA domain-containing protein [Streptomyces sp. ACA25]
MKFSFRRLWQSVTGSASTTENVSANEAGGSPAQDPKAASSGDAAEGPVQGSADSPADSAEDRPAAGETPAAEPAVTEPPAAPVVEKIETPAAPVVVEETPAADTAEEKDAPTAPVVEETETPAAPVVVEETPAANTAEEKDTPTAPVVEETETPAAPVVVEETPAADAPEDSAAAAETPSGPDQGSAMSLEELQASAAGLVDLYKAAQVSLEKTGLAGQRAAVYLVLDRSGSMRRYYKDGTVQHLAEQALALSANLDDDGVVPVVFFSTEVDGVADIALGDYSGRIEALHNSYGHMGRTNYHVAMQAVIDHYKASGATDPAFVIFQTDGAPTSRAAAESAVCEAAGLPIFWQFVGFGEPESKAFAFLRKLDVLAVPEKRVVDNAGFFPAGDDPRALSDAELYSKLMAEFPEWLTAARQAGLIN